LDKYGKPQKKVTWAVESKLESVRYFEVEEGERGETWVLCALFGHSKVKGYCGLVHLHGCPLTCTGKWHLPDITRLDRRNNYMFCVGQFWSLEYPRSQ